MKLLKKLRSGRIIPRCRKNFFLFLATGISIFTILSVTDASAQGNLLITPRRVVFEGNKRSFDLNLANTGKDTATYAISLVQIKMTDEGSFIQITEPEPGQNFADKYIRFFPRSVTLGPNEAQVVKIQLLKSGNLEPGEYRSHFYFRAVPKAVPLGEKENAVKDTTSISVTLTPVFGITIPVIIRVGDSNTRVTLSDLGFSLTNDTIPSFRFTFNRTGNMSVYGDIAVDYISPEGKITRVGIVNGVAVYTPNPLRRFQMNLNASKEINYRKGTLRVIYSASSDVKPVRYAEAELAIQ
jgi:P pilus assembly chaperone PapD